jgi:O-antigen ligase
MWAAIVLSNSRGGILATLCQAVFLVLAFGAIHTGVQPNEPRPPNRALVVVQHSIIFKVALAAVLLAGISFGTIWLGGDPLAERLVNVNEELTASQIDQTHSSRTEIWKATFHMFRAHPIFGTGIGAYLNSVTEYHPGTGALIPHQAHNDYLELLASGGLVGIGLFIAFCVLIFRHIRPRLKTGTSFERAACLGALVGLFGVAVHSVVDFGLHITVNAVVCASLLVIATASYRQLGVQKTILSKY